MKEKLLEKWSELNLHLLNFIKKRVDNTEDAEDLLQEVYIKLHENIDSLKDEEKMVSWMYQITRNTIYRCYKTCYKVKNVEFEETHGGQIDPDIENFNEEIAESMKNFIEELPNDYKEVIKLYEFEGYSHRDISKELDLKENTSKSKLKRGKERLKRLLDDCCVFQIDHYGNVVDYEKRKDREK